MRYKRQILLGPVAGIAVCSIAFWARSYCRLDALHWTDSRTFVNLASTSGCLRITFTRWPLAQASGWQWSASSARKTTTRPTLLGRPDQQFAGFQWDETLWRVKPRTFTPSIDHVVAVPYWAVCTLLCLPLAPSTVRWIRAWRRVRRGLCPICGYDVRASTNRCPECGNAIRGRAPSSTRQLRS